MSSDQNAEVGLTQAQADRYQVEAIGADRFLREIRTTTSAIRTSSRSTTRVKPTGFSIASCTLWMGIPWPTGENGRVNLRRRT